MTSRTAFAVVIIITALAINASAWAEDEFLLDRFMLRLGRYTIENASTIVRLDTTDHTTGTYVDFSDTLGGNSSATVARADGRYRFNDRHSIEFAWYDVKFTGSRVLARDITWGGQFLPVSTQVDSELEYTIYKLNYQYSLYHVNKVELGGLAGLHVMRPSANITAIGIGQLRKSATTNPLPVIGLFADYSFTPRFSIYYNYQFFFINYDNKARGGLQDFLFGLEYRLFRNVAVGAALNRFSLDAELKKEEATLNINTSWNGLMLYGAVYF